MQLPNTDITARDYFAINCPEYMWSEITFGDVKRAKNIPEDSNFSYPEQSVMVREYQCELRYRFADMMMKVRASTMPK